MHLLPQLWSTFFGGKVTSVLVNSIRDGLSLLTWEQDSFAFADSHDEGAARYRGLRTGVMVSAADAQSLVLLVKPGVARAQGDADRNSSEGMRSGVVGTGLGQDDDGSTRPETGLASAGKPSSMPVAAKPKRFHGTATLDSPRRAGDAPDN